MLREAHRFNPVPHFETRGKFELHLEGAGLVLQIAMLPICVRNHAGDFHPMRQFRHHFGTQQIRNGDCRHTERIRRSRLLHLHKLHAGHFQHEIADGEIGIVN